ncbi:MAG: radical SAM protein [Bacteroidetes bacterium]|nr:radical SAM protein [Bacteroidota bacterium]
MKRILLTHSYFLRFDPKQWDIMQPYAPLGTLYAASVLRNNGYEVALWDPMFAHAPEEIIPKLNEFNPDALVIYDDGFNYLTKMCLTNMRDAAFTMCKFANEKNIPVFVNSSDATDHFEKYLQKGATAVLKGEGEFTLLEVLKSQFAGHEINAIPGVITQKDSGFIKAPPREVVTNLDEIPFPAFDLADMNRYRSEWIKKHGYFSINMSTTRGCPFKCNWCAKPIYGNRYNSRSPENVVNEIKLLQTQFQIDHIWFCDDIFGLKPGWTRQFAELIKQEGLKIKYKIQSRVDLLLQENNIEALAESGCDIVWVGAESGSQKILDAMDKGTTISQIEQATYLLKKHHIKPAFFLQFGYPGETDEDINLTAKMVSKLLPYDIGISVSYPLPGTKFYENVKSQLSQKTNWTDSDELALMFSNTYPSEYYKHLHRYIHKNYRRHQGVDVLKNLVSGKEKWNPLNLKRAAWSVYHIPGEWKHKKEMTRIAHSTIPSNSSNGSVSQTAHAFDVMASNYDSDFTFTQTGELQRNRVHAYLLKEAPPAIFKNVLEVNCGTGYDAFWMVDKGYHVLATDASAQMIAKCQQKKTAQHRVEFIQTPFQELQKMETGKYDVIFSNFGGLNCAQPNDLKKMAAEFHRLLRPGGKLIAVIMGRKCIIERLYFLFKNDTAKRNRRKSFHPVKANVAGEMIDIWYYSPKEFAYYMAPFFELSAYKPIGLFLPPSYLDKNLKKIPGVLPILNQLEKLSTIHSGWSDYADHYLIDLTKR